jgi:hypothetical protein
MSMIYELSRAVDAKLQTRKFPVRVAYGTRRLTQEQFVDSVICFARDHDLGDEIRAPQGAKRNPRRRAVRELGVEIKLYVRASVPGAREEDHEFDCEQVVDALVCAIGEWFTGERGGFALANFTEARYMRADEFDEGLFEQWPGVGYVLRFRVPRSVEARDYLSQGQAMGAPTHVGGDVEIRRDGSDEPPEIVDLP